MSDPSDLKQFGLSHERGFLPAQDPARELPREFAQWDELGRVEPQSFTIANVERRLSRRGDPWRGLWRHARSLGEPRRRLDRLLAEEG